MVNTRILSYFLLREHKFNAKKNNNKLAWQNRIFPCERFLFLEKKILFYMDCCFSSFFLLALMPCNFNTQSEFSMWITSKYDGSIKKTQASSFFFFFRLYSVGRKQKTDAQNIIIKVDLINAAARKNFSSSTRWKKKEERAV